MYIKLLKLHSRYVLYTRLYFLFIILLVLDFYGALYVSKLKNKRVFIYPARNIQIQCRIYKSSQVHNISSTGFVYPDRDLYIHHRIYIYPVRDIYIHHRIYISSQGYIYPARDLYIQPGIYISSQGFIYPARDLYI